MMGEGGAMSEQYVTEVLCRSRQETQTKVLESIARDTKESREVGGKIMRRLFEGNGGPALDIQIHENTAFRLEREETLRAKERHRWVRNMTWAVAGAGWAIVLIYEVIKALA
jgi:hypothetical protein